MILNIYEFSTTSVNGHVIMFSGGNMGDGIHLLHFPKFRRSNGTLFNNNNSIRIDSR